MHGMTSAGAWEAIAAPEPGIGFLAVADPFGEGVNEEGTPYRSWLLSRSGRRKTMLASVTVYADGHVLVLDKLYISRPTPADLSAAETLRRRLHAAYPGLTAYSWRWE